MRSRFAPAGALPEGPHPEGFDAWYRTNVRPQRQEGYATAEITLPLGDFTSDQGRQIADLARKFTGDALRTTVEQNLMFRWVSLADLPELYAGLQKMGLAEAGAATIRDITSLSWNGYLQAGYLCFARACRRARQETPRDSRRSRPRGGRAAHQGKWLLQLLRSASRFRPRFPRRKPQRGRAPRAPLSGCARGTVDGERRLLRPCHRSGSLQARSRGCDDHHRLLCC